MSAHRDPEQHSLSWLIGPLTRDEYFDTYWEKRPLVVKRGQPDYFRRLLSFEDVDRVLTTLDRKYPDVCLKNANDLSITPADYTQPGGALDVARLYQLFWKGSTITLAFLDSVLPALTLFCRSLEAEFSCPFQTNVYMTPPGAQGAKPHYDTHDVFVLQIAGSKRWTIFGTPIESPLQTQEFDEKLHEIGAPTLEFELEPGDLAYIPRGVAHEARSTDTVSLHVTTGLLRYTWADLLLEVMNEAALNSPALRKALPPGFAASQFDRSQVRQAVCSLLSEVTAGSNIDNAVDGVIDRFMARCPPLLEGQMAQVAALPSLSVDTLAGKRPGVLARVETNGTSLIVDTYGRSITFPSQASEAVQFALNHSKFRVSDLPGNLDDSGKLTLIRRLISEGLAIALIE